MENRVGQYRSIDRYEFFRLNTSLPLEGQDSEFERGGLGHAIGNEPKAVFRCVAPSLIDWEPAARMSFWNQESIRTPLFFLQVIHGVAGLRGVSPFSPDDANTCRSQSSLI